MNTEEQILVKYYRISLEDASDKESGSIGNQRKIIDEYISNDSELAGMASQEFIDDGYTGTNFKRPGIGQVLGLLRQNKVACIIVKDFSRFTRDYIELGSYLEQVFPFMEVRFISVTEHYDSKTNSSVNGLEIPFKGLLNNLYSRDISVKVKAAKRQLIKQGRLCSGSYPFGYRKNPGGTPLYNIDELAAATVQLIFKLALEGKKNIEIARELNEQGLLTPGMYKRSNGDVSYGLREGQTAVWDSTKVLLILRDERYMGTLIVGRYQSAGVGSGKVIQAPEDMWYRKEGAIPAIIPKADFRAVQKLRPYQKRGRYKKERCVLYRKVKCGCCGRYLYFKPSDYGEQYNSFFCKQSHLDKSSKCFTGYIKEKAILDSLRLLFQKQVELYGNKENLMAESGGKDKDKKRLVVPERELELLKAEKIKDYQLYRDAVIVKETFLERKELIRQRVNEIEKEISGRKRMLLAEQVVKEQTDRLSKYGIIEKPDRGLIEELVDVVWVYDVDRVKVDLRFGGG